MSVNVKAYLLGKDEAVKEVRRFTVDQDVSSSFEYLNRKTTSVFTHLKSINMYYKDEDEDLVAFSSDDELMMGLTCMKDSTFRLFIKEKKENRRDFPLHAFPPFTFGHPPPFPPGAPHGPPPHLAPPHHLASPPLHRDVTCDGCEGPVVGTRFKCSVCPNYDLCSSCQAQGTHTEHPLLPIWHPLQWFPRGKWMKRMRHCMWNQNMSHAQDQDQDKTAEPAADSSAPSASQANVDFLMNIGEGVAAMLNPLGVYRKEATASLRNAESGRVIFRATMTLKMFLKILRVIRFDDKDTRADRHARDKLAPIRDVWDKWVSLLPLMYDPGTDVTVDERVVPFRGRCPFKQYIPSKPGKYGIKICCDCV